MKSLKSEANYTRYITYRKEDCDGGASATSASDDV